MFRFLKITFLWLICSTASGQSVKKIFNEGLAYLNSGAYNTAIFYFDEALKNDTGNIKILFHKAEALRLLGQEKNAFPIYLDIYKRDKGKTIPMALYWLAQLQKNKEEYKEAKKNFKKASSMLRAAQDKFYSQKAKKEAESCDFAEKNKQIFASGNYDISALNGVNSVHSDFGGSYDAQNNFIFSSLRNENDSLSYKENEKVKIYRIDKDATSKPEVVELKIDESTYGYANLCFNSNKSKAYFTVCETKNNCAIYKADYENSALKNPEKLNEKINAKGFTSTMPFIGKFENGREVLFFVSNRPGGLGNMDIWFCELEENGHPIIAKNAGKKVNSIDNEVSPFYDFQNKTLYFSSNWHNGFGGFDVFKSEGLPEKLANPQNLGKPFNSSANDLYFKISENQQSGFFSSNRPSAYNLENESCCNDIFKFENQTILQNDSIKIDSIKPSLTFIENLLPLSLYFHNDEPNPKSKSDTTEFNYLKTLENYTALKAEYLTEYSKGIDKNEIESAQIEMNSFFEDYVDIANEKLQKIAYNLFILLEKGYKIDISIKGYASALASTNYNFILTKRRIKSFVNFLYQYENGKLQPYLKNNLIVTELPFGDSSASQIKENLNVYDTRESVYSIKAAMDRRIEIVGASVKMNEPKNDSLSLNENQNQFENLQLKEIKYGEKVVQKIEIKNNSNQEMILFQENSVCDCLTTNLPKTIQPNESAFLEIHFNSIGKLGSNNFEIKIKDKNSDFEKLIQVQTEVVK